MGRLTKRMRQACIVAFAFTGLLQAQSQNAANVPLRGPHEGFVFDGPTRSIRAVNGMLGAASMGPVLLPELEYASLAPNADYGVAFRPGECLWVSNLESGQASTAAISRCSSLPEGVAWASDGSLAALYSRTENWIQLMTGFPGAPTAASLLDLSSLGASLISVAADGRHIAFGLGSMVYSMSPGQSFAPVLSQIQPTALTFSADGNTLYALDSSAHQITQVNLADLTSQSYAAGTLQDPIDLRAGLNGSVFVLGRADRLLIALDGSTHQAVSSVPLNFQPSGFTALGSASAVVRPRTSGRDPLWTFTTTPQTAIFFVPALSVLREEHGR